MSSRARLILLSGIGGAGTTTICAATAAALQAEGLRVEVIDASGPHEPDQAVVDGVASSIGRVLSEVGADPVLSDAWAELPGVAHLSALARVVRALAEPGVDAVVVDAGDLRSGRELVNLPMVLWRLLDAALTPRLAMWRSGAGGAGESVFDALSGARSDVTRMAQALTSPATTMRLVTTSDDHALTRTERAMSAAAMLGVAVDGIVVNRFPRAAEGASKAAVARAGAGLDRLTVSAGGVPVWKSTAKVRPVPKGRSAMGPLGLVHVLDADQLTVVLGEEDFALELPLAGPARTEGRVGRQGDHLVVAFDGATRWLALPPVLRRCIPTQAQRTASGLRVTFVPDPGAWRAPEVAS